MRDAFAAEAAPTGYKHFREIHAVQCANKNLKYFYHLPSLRYQ